MVIFGGFNGEYFNDLHYINLFEVKKKMELNNKNSIGKANFEKYLNNKELSDGSIVSSDEK